VELIGDEERVDLLWEASNADERREVYDRERAALDALRRHDREARPLPERFARAMAEIASLQTAPAGRIERARGGSGEGMGPPAAETLDVGEHLRVIATKIADIERAIDIYRGVTVEADRKNMRTFEKDKILFGSKDQPSEFVGMHARDVAEAAPYLGSERTIRRLRAERDLNVYGYEREPRPLRG
jgi:hypothetical protein